MWTSRAIALGLALGLAASARAQSTASVGNFVKTTDAAPATQSIPHKLGQTPSALFIWTEARTDEQFSSATSVQFRAATKAGVASGVLTLTINLPAGTLQNDLMIAAISVNPSTATITPPDASWTLVRRTNNGNNTTNALAIYRKTAGASEPASYSWTLSAHNGAAGGIMSVYGVDLQNPIDVENAQANANSVNQATPAVTTTTTNEMIVTAHSMASAATWTPPNGMNEVVDVASGALGAAGQCLEMNWVSQAAIGTTGTKTGVASGNADRGVGQILALRPAYSNHASVGVTDGTTSGSISTSTRNGVATSVAARRAADKALTIVKWDQTVLAEADLTSWDDTNFTITWTTNDTVPYVIHFIAIGGPGVLAKVVNWQMATATGPQSITGVGFQPTAIVHIHANSGHTATPPSTSGQGGMGFGVMDATGAQWATSTFSSPANPSDTQRGQQTNATIYTFTNALGVAKRAAFTSMDADGFTINYSVANASAGQVYSLALAGVNFKAGNFNKVTGAAPVLQNITGVGFLPQAVFLHSFQDVAQANPVVHARLGYGASDGSSGNSSAFAELNGASPTNTQGIDKTSAHFMKVNNSTSTIDAEANLTNLNTDGFGLNWTTNDAVATQMLYFAIAPLAPTEVRLVSFDATRYDRGTLLQWKTGYEIDNLGFNLYREVDGVRTRVNASLIGGSGLLAGRGTAVNAEQSYARWDLQPAARSASVTYWLEDLDFYGKNTLHGPITPVQGAWSIPEPTVTASSDLSELARPRKGKVFFKRNEAWEPQSRRASRPSAGDPTVTQWTIAGQAAVKIAIDRPGWYRVTQPDLLAAGLSPRVDPRVLRLFVEGTEQALLVTGDADGRFDPADAIEFYATGVDTPFTDTRVYWLVAGETRGLRTTSSSAAPDAASRSGATSFWSTLQRKDRSVYFAALENGDAENWFGPLVSSEPAHLTLDANHIDPASPGPAHLDVSLQGVTSGVPHQVAVLVNGAEIGQLAFKGQTLAERSFSIPAGVLIDGENDVALVSRGGDADYSLVDVLRLSYWHTYRADADLLRFTVDAAGPVTVGGFASPAIRVVDITDLSATRELRGTTRAETGGYFGVSFRVTGNGPRTLLAFTDATISTPASVAANRPSNWHAAGQAHDYVIVAHPRFVDSVKPLIDLRASEGYRPVVADVEEIYDEFSFGEKTPQAIRDFLQRAKAVWSMPPNFVVLAGDATADPRDYAGMGDADLVPTMQVPMKVVSLETASDDWFVDFDDNGLPDIPIGRLSVRTAEQADAVVAKIVSYDPRTTDAWTRNVLLVADANDDTSNFEKFSDMAGAFVPSDRALTRVFRGGLGADLTRESLTRAVNDGQLLVNFTGHGSVQIWGKDGDLLTNADVASLWRNSGRLPLVVAMNCLNGLFDQIWDEESLAEALQRAPDGGAVAVWASSSVTSSATQALVNAELFRLIFQGGYGTVGEAIAAAKRAVTNPDLRRSWIFFGDPAMRLAGPRTSTPTPTSEAPFAVVAGDASGSPLTPSNAHEHRAAGARSGSTKLPDFDGDHVADVLTYAVESGRWTAALSHDPAGALRQGVWAAGWVVVAADLNGDDRSDLAFYNHETSEWVQAITTAPGVFAFTRGRWPGSTGPDIQVRVGDFDGDGSADVLTYSATDGAWTIGISNGRGGFAFARGVMPPSLSVTAADLNGDGLSDVIGYDPSSGRGVIALAAKGASFALGGTDWGRGWQLTGGRFGGRGGADLFFYNPNTGAWQEMLNDGHARFSVLRGAWPAGFDVRAADLDGDGRDDLFGYNAATGEWLAAQNEAPGRFAVGRGSWAPGWQIATGEFDRTGRDQIITLDPASGNSFQCVEEAPAVLDCRPRAWAPGGVTLVGQPR